MVPHTITLPSDLNSLLYHYERDLANFAEMVGQGAQRGQWLKMAEARQQAINKYLWNPGKGMFFDYDFTTGTTVQLRVRDDLLSSLGRPGYEGTSGGRGQKSCRCSTGPDGLASSTYESGLQWDLPFGWAPLNWFAADGLWTNGYINDARRIAEEFTHTVRTSFEKEGTIHEKYNVETGSSNVDVIAGYQNVIGFGWTNAVYVEIGAPVRIDHRRKEKE